MTDEQINAAIAEACGWTNVSAMHRSGRCPGADDLYVGREFLPDYCKDLNAMHEAEKVLQNQFTTLEEAYWRNLNRVKPHPIYATARQRAEAFLRTLGKWSATVNDSLTVGATTEESSVVQREMQK